MDRALAPLHLEDYSRTCTCTTCMYGPLGLVVSAPGSLYSEKLDILSLMPWKKPLDTVLAKNRPKSSSTTEEIGFEIDMYCSGRKFVSFLGYIIMLQLYSPRRDNSLMGQRRILLRA
jgi:hypothetical protein